MRFEYTICALATPPAGALAIIRVSGARSLCIVSDIFSKNITDAKGYTMHYGNILDKDGTRIDEVLITVFRAPHSYTGEDSVEISCHGSRYIVNKVLERLVNNGCHMAEPGEYTMRAYLNGKMDLSQAEAVADLIASTNKATHQLAMNQLRGHYSTKLVQLREQLLKLTSLLELELDFSDHEELEFADRSELITLAKLIDEHITTLYKSFETGQAIKQGIPVAITGKTNVGKSTLLNALLNDERAIVSDIHGTTRDTIEDTIDIHGATFRFIDTAGIRQTSDTVEQIGIERTYQAIRKANIIIWMVDQEPTQKELHEMTALCKDKAVIPVFNKSDIKEITNLHFSISDTQILRLSAKKGTGIENLKNEIYKQAHLDSLMTNEVIVTNARHYDALLRAHESIQHVINGLQDQITGDLLAEDLRQALSILSEITGGQITPQETLNNIFSHFCVGK
ncbi:MAG: tRNA uridine-5-carboxymethylaminomethyl(34) synthesis GTPase MnmE [Prevotella sp.]|nr:tRNA uridine-5-carboxymethylaminomethyl(34) synthesis GTPase MnmE [Prevotella sp.]